MLFGLCSHEILPFNITDGFGIEGSSHLPIVNSPRLESSGRCYGYFYGLNTYMQTHNADYLTKTEVGVINNYNREVQNVNAGNNYGMFNWAVSHLRFSAVF